MFCPEEQCVHYWYGTTPLQVEIWISHALLCELNSIKSVRVGRSWTLIIQKEKCIVVYTKWNIFSLFTGIDKINLLVMNAVANLFHCKSFLTYVNSLVVCERTSFGKSKKKLNTAIIFALSPYFTRLAFGFENTNTKSLG